MPISEISIRNNQILQFFQFQVMLPKSFLSLYKKWKAKEIIQKMTCHYNFQFFYIILQMKQQISGEAVSHAQEHEQSRKEKIERKRKIRKQKVQKSYIDFADLRSIDTSKLSREEKAKVQKAKNREAAQRSRDMHKEYVSNLQKEVKDLKELLGVSRKLCWRCQKKIEESTILDNYSNQHIIQSKSVEEQKDFIDYEHFQELIHSQSHSQQLIHSQSHSQQLIHSQSHSQQLIHSQSHSQQLIHSQSHSQQLIHSQSHINNSMFGEQEYFLRAQSQEESYPYMKSLFFVSMVVLAVICVSSITKDKFQSRALMEIPQLEAKQEINKSDKLQTKLNDVRNLTQDKNKTAVVKVENPHYGLIAFNNDDCIKSLIKSTQPTPYIKKSLTSYSDSSTQNSLTYSEGALVCSMPKTKSFKNQANEQRSPLVRLYLLGSQVKELISNFGLMVPIMDTNIQLNGIYQILAKIKQVNMVTNHNCLL